MNNWFFISESIVEVDPLNNSYVLYKSPDRSAGIDVVYEIELILFVQPVKLIV